MRSVTSIREFASQVVALLKKKISRHYSDMEFDVFARREVEKRDWSEGREKELVVLESFLPGPEYSLLAATLERSAFQADATLGEAYTAKCNKYCKVLSEKGKDKFVSGECSLLELEWTVCWRWTLFSYHHACREDYNPFYLRKPCFSCADSQARQIYDSRGNPTVEVDELTCCVV